LLYYSKKEDEEEYSLHNVENEQEFKAKSIHDRARVIDLKGAVHFSAAEDLKQQLEEFFEEESDFIIRMRNVRRFDITIIKVLDEFVDKVQESGGEVLLTGVNQEILDKLHQIGLAEKISGENIYFSEKEIFASTSKAITSSENNKKNNQIKSSNTKTIKT